MYVFIYLFIDLTTLIMVALDCGYHEQVDFFADN